MMLDVRVCPGALQLVFQRDHGRPVTRSVPPTPTFHLCPDVECFFPDHVVAGFFGTQRKLVEDAYQLPALRPSLDHPRSVGVRVSSLSGWGISVDVPDSCSPLAFGQDVQVVIPQLDLEVAGVVRAALSFVDTEAPLTIGKTSQPVAEGAIYSPCLHGKEYRDD